MNNGRHGVPDTHVWDPALGRYLAEGSDPGALLKRAAPARTPAQALVIARQTSRALRQLEARQATQPATQPQPEPAEPSHPSGLHVLPPQPAGACIICGATKQVRFYITGYHCTHHTPPDRVDYYGLAVPINHTAYDPERLAKHQAAQRTARLRPPPPEDSPIRGWCERCQNGWPLNDASEIGPSSAVHYQTVHADGGWLVGPKGGAAERTCAPCGGESPGGFRIVNGKEIQLPGKGEPFGPTFASARHDLCQNGERRGRYTIRCDCQHRTGKQPPTTPPKQVTA